MYFGDAWQFIGFCELLRINIISIICVFLLLGVFISIRTFKKEINGCHDAPKRIIEIENTNENYIVFFTTYIIPLLDWDMGSFRDLITLVTIITINGWLLIKTDLYYQNPILAMMGFNIYKATVFSQGVEWNTILIANKKLKKNMEVCTHDLDEKEIMLAN